MFDMYLHRSHDMMPEYTFIQWDQNIHPPRKRHPRPKHQTEPNQTQENRPKRGQTRRDRNTAWRRESRPIFSIMMLQAAKVKGHQKMTGAGRNGIMVGDGGRPWVVERYRYVYVGVHCGRKESRPPSSFFLQ